MSAELINSFVQYQASVSIEYVRIRAVRSTLQPLLKAYREALAALAPDPQP